jgi:hypothetical protein
MNFIETCVPFSKKGHYYLAPIGIICNANSSKGRILAVLYVVYSFFPAPLNFLHTQVVKAKKYDEVRQETVI